MQKAIIDNDWILKDTSFVRLPAREKFVSFMKVKRRLFVLSNKAIYEMIYNKKIKVYKHKKPYARI